ncbi:MAG: G8 domain-containing protein [Cyanobacteria bacterium P01_D01_bin.1]
MKNASMPVTMSHSDMSHAGMNHHSGMMAIEKLINSAKPTHTAVRSGAWSNPSTWQGGRVPNQGATVLIDKGTTVTYDQMSDAEIKTIAIKGNLKFATGKDTQLKVETIINAPAGQINIGSARQAVRADKRARIIFTSDRAVNTGWDPEQLTKGLVSHGSVNIYGADKKDHVRLAKDVSAGDSTITFKDDLSGWRVGDEIVIAGTGYSYNGSHDNNSRSQDEVLTITEINGRQIKFVNNDITSDGNNVLKFDHKRHSKLNPNEIDLYAANLSRNVSFETENGKDVPLSHRAHVMLMHNPDVNIFNAGFYDLGRSDKSKVVDDIGQNVDGSKGRGTNIRGRYSLHLHLTGLDPNETVLLKGNAISGSPGWGIVQHESRAGLEDNVVFDTVGSGFAAESGNETGWWTNNMSIKSTGIRWDAAAAQRDNREKKFDFGFEGDGFWIQGAAQIANRGNKAFSSNHTGMSLFSGSLDTNDFRPIKTIAVDTLPAQMQKHFVKGQKEVDIRLVPMADVTGFVGYNNTKGLDVWGHKTNFDGELAFSGDVTREEEFQTAHQGRSLVEDFTLWGNRWNGLSVQYSSNIDIKDGTIAGQDRNDSQVSGGNGVFVNHATFNSTVDGVTVDGFKQGIHFEQLNSDKNYNNNTLKNSALRNNTYNLSKISDDKLNGRREDDFSAFTQLRNNRFEDKAGINNRAPVAKFSSRGIGGLSVKFDASASYDADPYIPKDGRAPAAKSKGIAGYAWDVDNNGRPDYFGRTLKHTFRRAGRQKVELTVLDAQGKAATTTQTINVQPTNYGNAFLGGSFGAGTPIQAESWMSSTQWADGGWYTSARIAGGVARLSRPGEWGSFIGQIVRNESIHKGAQTLNFRLKNIEGSTEREFWKNNDITVNLWGVNGQFANRSWEPTGPSQVGTLPMQHTQLLSQQYGGEDGEFFDWKNISLDVDLGSGYEYLLFQVNATRAGDAGDDIAIDNVSLIGEANSAPPRPTPKPKPTPEPSTPLSIAKLSFEEKGKRALDISQVGMNNFGLLQGSASHIKGKKGMAVGFDGEGARVRLRNSKDLNRGTHSERTVSLWFKADQPTASGKQVIYEEGQNVRGMNLYLDDGLLNFGGWNRSGPKWQGDWESIGKVKAGEWNHVALVLDGDEMAKGNALTAYLNGRQAGQARGAQLGSRGVLSLGSIQGKTRFQDGIAKQGSAGFVGGIDELEVFNTALSADQVKQLATA